MKKEEWPLYRNNPNLIDFDAVMDADLGKEGSPEREAFRKEAYAYLSGQIIRDARKEAHTTQGELAKKIGTTRSYISSVEKGQIEPGVGTFYRIMGALGFRIEILRPFA